VFCYLQASRLILLLTTLSLTHCCWAISDQLVYQHLLIQARTQKIWNLHEWEVLLHYSPRILNTNTRSLVDDSAFFLSPQGKNFPQAELETTLWLLLQPADDDDKAIACRFPARTRWLIKVLNISPQMLQRNSCEQFQHWLKPLIADTLTLVFPVSVLNSPASMFGHTFLRLDRKTAKFTDLLAWTISYAADTHQEKGLSFAFKGLTGGYPGKFSITPYHSRVKEYTDIESRDIWEYQLNFNREEIQILLEHLWELLPVYFEYFFIDENCAYQLLSLLEIARPDLKLLSQFYFDASPVETVRAVANIPGLLKSVHFRPSNQKIINARTQRISMREQLLAQQLADDALDLHNPELLVKPEPLRAQILELAYDYLSYQQAMQMKFTNHAEIDLLEKARQQRLFELLSARSELAIKSQQPKVASPDVRPDQGHYGRRLGLRAGFDQPWWYQQVDFRWAYHDLYDPPRGFAQGAQLEFFKPAIRYYSSDNYWQFESIDLVNLISMPVRTEFIKPFSWELSASVQRHRIHEQSRPLMGDFKAGIGMSFRLTINSQVAVFINTGAMLSDAFRQFLALSAGGRMEMLWQLSENWQSGVYANVMQYFQGMSETNYRFGNKQQWSIDQHNSIILEVSAAREFGVEFVNTQLSWQYYF
jgi:hypothetical protein